MVLGGGVVFSRLVVLVGGGESSVTTFSFGMGTLRVFLLFRLFVQKWETSEMSVVRAVQMQ